MLKKIKYYLLFFFVFAIFPISHCKAKNKDQKVTAMSNSFVKVVRELNIIKCQKGKKCLLGTFRSTGSGASLLVHKKYDTVLTAGHMCVANVRPSEFGEVEVYSMSLTVINYRKEIKKTEIIIQKTSKGGERKSDLCMFYVHDLKIPKLKMASKSPSIGERVIAMSAPGGIYHPPVVPIFTGLYSGNINEYTSLVTISSSPGSSGGPVMNSKGKIVGVIYAVFLYNNQVTLMNNFEKTLTFANSVKKIIYDYEKSIKK